MKRLKKLFAFLIIVSMLITVLGGCGGETADDNQTDSVAQETAAAQFPHKRLQSVTVYDKEEGTTETYDVEWKDDGCYFRTDEPSTNQMNLNKLIFLFISLMTKVKSSNSGIFILIMPK